MRANSFVFLIIAVLFVIFVVILRNLDISLPEPFYILIIVGIPFVIGFFLAFVPKSFISYMLYPYLPPDPAAGLINDKIPRSKLEKDFFRKIYDYEKRILNGKYGTLCVRIVGVSLLLSSFIWFYILK